MAEHPEDLVERVAKSMSGQEHLQMAREDAACAIDAIRAWDREQPGAVTDEMVAAYAVAFDRSDARGIVSYSRCLQTRQRAGIAAALTFLGHEDRAKEWAAMKGRAEAAEDALRDLASYAGNGGYNAPTVDAEQFKAKIRDGIDHLVSVETKRREYTETEALMLAERALKSESEIAANTRTIGELSTALTRERDSRISALNRYDRARIDLEAVADALCMNSLSPGDETPPPTAAEMVAEIGRMHRDYAELSDTLEATKKDYQEYREQKTSKIAGVFASFPTYQITWTLTDGELTKFFVNGVEYGPKPDGVQKPEPAKPSVDAMARVLSTLSTLVTGLANVGDSRLRMVAARAIARGKEVSNG